MHHFQGYLVTNSFKLASEKYKQLHTSRSGVFPGSNLMYWTCTFYTTLMTNEAFIYEDSSTSTCHFQNGILDLVYLTHKGQRLKVKLFFPDLARHDLWHFFGHVGGHGRRSQSKKAWPLTFDPYGSNKPSPKCQFENGKFKLRSLTYSLIHLHDSSTHTLTYDMWQRFSFM